MDGDKGLVTQPGGLEGNDTMLDTDNTIKAFMALESAEKCSLIEIGRSELA